MGAKVVYFPKNAKFILLKTIIIVKNRGEYVVGIKTFINFAEIINYKYVSDSITYSQEFRHT